MRSAHIAASLVRCPYEIDIASVLNGVLPNVCQKFFAVSTERPDAVAAGRRHTTATGTSFRTRRKGFSKQHTGQSYRLQEEAIVRASDVGWEMCFEIW
ncbi:hypothetical protein EVAR_41165_1 [Eumeta japonica]|uniref:Uncharacterized protein n=1 Tax=Eumeta variegata TaxID=151549 RepID=A0A4C1YAE0_EUMVA|nr:hypothetical protein EVAR_41165_1 [Eumeta japonica]